MHEVVLASLTWALALVPLAPLAPQDAAAPPRAFTVQVLETLGASGPFAYERAVAINDAGLVVGSVETPTGSHAALWSLDGTLTDLGTSGGGQYAWARAINDAGVVVGSSLQAGSSSAFVWTAAGGMVPLPLPPNCSAFGVNDSGAIAMMRVTPDFLYVGASWTPPSLPQRIQALGADILVRGINDAGSVTGIHAAWGDHSSAFRWSPQAGLTLLDPPAAFVDSQGYAVREGGEVVGLSRAGLVDQATRWGLDGTAVLLPYARSGDQVSSAYAVNSLGWIVGAEYEDATQYNRTCGVVWIDDVAYDLNDLLRQTTGNGEPLVYVTAAQGVNDQGQIAGQGVVNGERRAIRLDPVW